MHKDVFYITAAGDLIGDTARVRRCTAVSVYRHAATRFVALCVEVDPPYFVEVRGVKRLVSTVYLCPHNVGGSVDPVSAFPLCVRVLRPKTEIDRPTESYGGFEVIARAVMSSSEREAIMEFNRWTEIHDAAKDQFPS
jgi:hypothetical protein